eukprot:786454-Rhodomonas_salina.1
MVGRMCACSVEYSDSTSLTHTSVPSKFSLPWGFVCVLGVGWGSTGWLKTRSHVIGHVTGALVRLYGVRASCLFDFKRSPGAG